VTPDFLSGASDTSRGTLTESCVVVLRVGVLRRDQASRIPSRNCGYCRSCYLPYLLATATAACGVSRTSRQYAHEMEELRPCLRLRRATPSRHVVRRTPCATFHKRACGRRSPRHRAAGSNSNTRSIPQAIADHAQFLGLVQAVRMETITLHRPRHRLPECRAICFPGGEEAPPSSPGAADPGTAA
jgi:hypothetical protein